MSIPEIKIAAVIPARMASSRLPGKPLLKLEGLPMIEHVRRRANLCSGFSEVVVATCDQEIAEVIQSNGGRVVMTSPKHPAATDRVAEAIEQLDCTHVVNLQGDEILVLPQELNKFLLAIQERPDVPFWNAVAPLPSDEALADRSLVKCALSVSGKILFCARDFSAVPFPQEGGGAPMHQILGILGYRRDALLKYCQLNRTPLEIAESIDQSRILEHDLPLESVQFQGATIGINEQREVALVQKMLDQDPIQQTILQEVLTK